MITLFNDDCREALKQIKSDSVDLVLTDPPYNLGQFMLDRNFGWESMRGDFFVSSEWGNESYEDWEKLMDGFFEQSARVLKKGGCLVAFMAIIRVESCVRIADKYGFYYKTTGVGHKSNPVPRNKELQFVYLTEQWMYFVHGRKTGTFNNDGELIHDFVEMPVVPVTEKEYGRHPTQKPEELMRHFIDILTNPEDTVLDPFMGSGTTGVAAKTCNRNFIGVEKNKEYFDMAQRRINGTMAQMKMF